MEVLDKNSNIVGEILTCTPTADLKCEILWTIPEDTPPGTYWISVNDSKITVEKEIDIK